jgi:Bacterial Ig domain/RTX calcium-binding nonapeptide repeat (4 copies)
VGQDAVTGAYANWGGWEPNDSYTGSAVYMNVGGTGWTVLNGQWADVKNGLANGDGVSTGDNMVGYFVEFTPVDKTAPVPFKSDAIKNSNSSLTTLSGMSEANSAVSVFDGNKLLGTATADNFGNWSLQANIAGTVHKFSETATDLAGNTGASAGVTVYSPSANKTLVGGSGNDFLIAGPKDTLTGGAGNDAFVFNANFGKVAVSDFDINHDVLWLSNALFAHDTIAQVLSQTHDTTAGAVIAVDGHDTITLHGVTVAQLAAHPSDFHFF